MSLKKRVFLFIHKLNFLLTEMEESASVCSLSNSLILLSLFVSMLHHGVVTICLGEAGVGDLLSNAETVDESFLFFNLFLLQAELILHCLELFGQEVVLLSHLLSSDRQTLVVFLSSNEEVANSSKFFLSLVDLLHITACLESTLFHELRNTFYQKYYVLLTSL